MLMASPSWATNWCDDDNAVACYPMNEGSGTEIADNSSNSNTITFATSTAAPEWEVMAGTNAPSYADYMVTCDGGDDYMSAPNHASITFGTGNFSIAMWAIGINANFSPTTISKGFLSGGDWMLRSSNCGNADFYGDAGLVSVSYGDLTTNVWTHTTVVVDGADSAKMYREGVLRSTDSSISTADFDSSADLIFCNANGASRWWSGSVSETLLTNDLLDSTEINDIIDNGLGVSSDYRIPTMTEFR